ncbi:MAG: ribosomal protein S18 acetylase RimI-like enzyme [Bradymonadia bacterium]|jgi:ribosomal protein S18 acetylase RimI-like enzyme
MKPKITVETATEADVDRITALFMADMRDLGVSPEQGAMREVAAAAITDERIVVRVARQAGKTVGVLLANDMLSIKFPGRALWIEELYVAPEARRQGLGRILVEDLLDWALQHDYKGVELEAYRMNTAASILYRSVGFSRLARERYSFDLSDWELDA